MTYSISHTDLDGYASQLIVASKAKEFNSDLKMFNVNYGKPLTEAIILVLSEIKEKDSFFITDLNLDETQASLIQEALDKTDFIMTVLDHHETGKTVAAKYPWYHYDKTKCGTQITFEYFGSPEKFKNIAYFTNLYDLWQMEETDFNKSKCLNQSLMDRKSIFPKPLSDMQRDFNFFIIGLVSEALSSCIDIQSVEEKVYGFERLYFDTLGEQSNNTLHSVRIRKMYEEIIKQKMYTKVTINGLTGEVYTGLSAIFQEYSSLRNNRREDIDFVCNINSQGYIGFRSIGNVNVANISKEFFNGGGHANAAGGSLPGVSEGKRYKENELVSTFIEVVS